MGRRSQIARALSFKRNQARKSLGRVFVENLKARSLDFSSSVCGLENREIHETKYIKDGNSWRVIHPLKAVTRGKSQTRGQSYVTNRLFKSIYGHKYSNYL